MSQWGITTHKVNMGRGGGSLWCTYLHRPIAQLVARPVERPWQETPLFHILFNSDIAFLVQFRRYCVPFFYAVCRTLTRNQELQSDSKRFGGISMIIHTSFWRVYLSLTVEQSSSDSATAVHCRWNPTSWSSWCLMAWITVSAMRSLPFMARLTAWSAWICRSSVAIWLLWMKAWLGVSSLA